MSTTPQTTTPTRRARRGGAVRPDDAPVLAGDAAASSAEAAADSTAAERSERSERRRERAAELWRRVLHVGRLVSEIVRPLGWLLLAVAVVLWWLALAFSWAELFVAAVVATTVLVLSLLFLIGRTGYDVALDLTRTRVVVGERAVGALALVNATSRSILPSEVVLPVGAGRGMFQVPRLAPGARHEELFAIPTAARGVLSVGPVSVRRGDPLGLFERTHDRRQSVELFVHPRTTALEGLSLGHLRDLEGLPVQELARDDVSFHALREYQPGDDLRHVHWRSTARVGEVMVREYEQTRRSHFVVALSTHPGEYREPDEFELAISVAGSVGLRALRDSRALDARTQRGPLRAPSGRRFLDALSSLGSSRPREGGLVDLTGAVATHAPDAAVVVLVTGVGTSSAALRQACARVPQGVRTLAVVADLRVPAPALQRIGDADVITIGALDQLPRALRKVLS